MAKNKGLGKGFGSLLPDDFDSSVILDKKDRVRSLPLQDIKPNPNQPRKHFDAAGISELSDSIKRYGILQPLVVTPAREGYEIIAGERRWRASQKAGLSHVPALVRSSEELERLEIGLVENVQRVDLSPLEQAASIARLHEEFNLSYEEIAQKLGKAHTTIVNMARLLQLPERAKTALSEGKISEGHARTVLALKNQTKLQNDLLKKIISNKLSVRQAEQFVQAQKKVAGGKTRAAKPAETLENVSEHLGAPATIRRGRKGGAISIAFGSEEELKRIVKKIIS